MTPHTPAVNAAGELLPEQPKSVYSASGDLTGSYTGAAHTPGPWKIYEARHPYSLRRVGNVEFKGGEHIEYRIGTEWTHPQLKGPMPVVTVSVGIGNEEVKAHYFVSTSLPDALLIAAAPDLKRALKACAAVLAGEEMNKNALIDALELARAALTKAGGAVEGSANANQQISPESSAALATQGVQL